MCVCNLLRLFSFHFLPTFLPSFRFLEIQKPRLCKVIRVLAFAYPYMWDSLPIFYRLFLFPGESAQNEATSYHQKHMIMTLLASFLYSAHLPERLAPGRFDYIGEWATALLLCSLPTWLGRVLSLTLAHGAAKGREGQGERPR